MSHFTVAVILENSSIEELESVLAPYDENMSVEPYVSETKEEIIKKAKEYKAKYAEKENAGEEICGWMREYLDAETDGELYQLATDDDEEYDENGNRLSTYNPKSKWDWYDIGGRWRNALMTKAENDDTWEHNSFAEHRTGKRISKQAPVGYKWVNGAKIKDIEFAKMNEGKAEEALREWELYVEKQEPINDKEKSMVDDNIWNKEYYIERYGTKENYVNFESKFHTFALVDKTGWYEKGKMGWWGFDSATAESTNKFFEFFQNYIANPINQEKYMVIVDCHI